MSKTACFTSSAISLKQSVKLHQKTHAESAEVCVGLGTLVFCSKSRKILLKKKKKKELMSDDAVLP